jgi:acid phosphatase (class A)
MRLRPLIVIANVAIALAGCVATASVQQQGVNPAPVTATPAPVRGGLSPNGDYLNAASLDLYRLLPPPPQAGSVEERAELDELLRLQATRTPAEVRRAQEDATVSIFRFGDALGSPAAFNPQQLPLTAELFRRVIHAESLFMDTAKDTFGRPRPFRTEGRLSPVVGRPDSASYPSGHTTFAIASAIVLADMLPERRAQIFGRADEYGHNREVAGVHYPSDVAAGHLAGTALAQQLFNSPAFVADEGAATAELRAALGLPPLPQHPPYRH